MACTFSVEQSPASAYREGHFVEQHQQMLYAQPHSLGGEGSLLNTEETEYGNGK